MPVRISEMTWQITMEKRSKQKHLQNHDMVKHVWQKTLRRHGKSQSTCVIFVNMLAQSIIKMLHVADALDFVVRDGCKHVFDALSEQHFQKDDKT